MPRNLHAEAADILSALAETDELADVVLSHLDMGMRDEWDIDLAHGLALGFGGQELQIAARSAHARAVYFAREEQH